MNNSPIQQYPNPIKVEVFNYFAHPERAKHDEIISIRSSSSEKSDEIKNNLCEPKVKILDFAKIWQNYENSHKDPVGFEKIVTFQKMPPNPPHEQQTINPHPTADKIINNPEIPSETSQILANPEISQNLLKIPQILQFSKKNPSPQLLCGKRSYNNFIHNSNYSSKKRVLRKQNSHIAKAMCIKNLMKEFKSALFEKTKCNKKVVDIVKKFHMDFGQEPDIQEKLTKMIKNLKEMDISKQLLKTRNAIIIIKKTFEPQS